MLEKIISHFIPRAVDNLLGDLEPGAALCGQVSVALASNTPLQQVCSVVGYDTLLAKQAYQLLSRFGVKVRTVSGSAFAKFHGVHKTRYGGQNFRAIAFIDAPNNNMTTELGHMVYLEGERIFDPATKTWRKVTDGDRALFSYIAVIV